MHDWVAVVVSIIAAIISVISLTRQIRLGHETTTQKLIHDQYQLCRALDLLRVDNPKVSHMLALPAQYGGKPWRNYERFKNYVCQLFSDNGSITEASRARIYLQEHATALHVYDIYEQTLLQRNLAKQAGDKGRFKVLDELAVYYEDRMLRNPRLRFHWDNGGSDMMEKSTLERYDRNVRNKYPGDFTDDKSPLDSFEDQILRRGRHFPWPQVSINRQRATDTRRLS
jgi:hypothetical protein